MSTHKPNYAPSQQAIKIAVVDTLILTRDDPNPLLTEAVTLLRQASDKIDRAEMAHQQAEADEAAARQVTEAQEHKG